jgi:hypothetical protein
MKKVLKFIVTRENGKIRNECDESFIQTSAKLNKSMKVENDGPKSFFRLPSPKFEPIYQVNIYYRT